MGCIMEAVGLNKSYGGFRALNDFNFRVEQGRIVGILGPNGSGKTTFIKILSGLLTYDSGSVTIDGIEPGSETKSLVSYLPERPYFNSWMRVDECLDFFEDFYADFDRLLAEKMLFVTPLNMCMRVRAPFRKTEKSIRFRQATFLFCTPILIIITMPVPKIRGKKFF